MTDSNAEILAIGRHRLELDGTGIRTLVIFAGCPLRCKYCINPYSWDNSRDSVTYTPKMLLKRVAVDSIYFQATNGGITFGGGEPLLSSHFISEFIEIAPNSWNYVIETSLAVPFDNIKIVSDKINHFVVDIKSLDSKIYTSYTGGNLEIPQNNLLQLLSLIGPERITVRIPQIRGFVDRELQKKHINKLRKIGITNIDDFTYKVR